MKPLLFTLFITCTITSPLASSSVRTVHDFAKYIEVASFTVIADQTNPTRKLIKLYDTCNNCPTVLSITPKSKILIDDEVITAQGYLKLNRLYEADSISFNPQDNTVNGMRMLNKIGAAQ